MGVVGIRPSLRGPRCVFRACCRITLYWIKAPAAPACKSSPVIHPVAGRATTLRAALRAVLGPARPVPSPHGTLARRPSADARCSAPTSAPCSSKRGATYRESGIAQLRSDLPSGRSTGSPRDCVPGSADHGGRPQHARPATPHHRTNHLPHSQRISQGSWVITETTRPRGTGHDRG